VETVLQEDVDVLGLSILSGAHMTLFPKIIELMEKKGLNDVLVFAGGIIPEEDISPLKKLGVKEIFGPGTPTDTVVNFVKEHVEKSR
jgi:methylmalonyl-CoA mutase C-terminal domain/subunit